MNTKSLKRRGRRRKKKRKGKRIGGGGKCDIIVKLFTERAPTYTTLQHEIGYSNTKKNKSKSKLKFICYDNFYECVEGATAVLDLVVFAAFTVLSND